MRLFVGLSLASEVLNELSEAVARLKSPNDGLRWTTPDTWHITLQFLGNTDQKHCGSVLAGLAEIETMPVQVQLGKLGFFDRAGVFFVDVVPTADLVALAERVTAATVKCGFPAEPRPYHPHITLARAKRDERGRPLKMLHDLAPEGTQFTGFMATEFLLYESFTRPDGARYEVRGRFGLGLAG